VEEIGEAFDKIGLYNIFPPTPTGSMLMQVACSLPHVKELCLELPKVFHHEGVDDPATAANALSYSPSGSSWRTWRYYF